MIAIVELKKDMTSACIFCIVVGKFSNEKVLSPVILLMVNKNLKIGLHSTI